MLHYVINKFQFRQQAGEEDNVSSEEEAEEDKHEDEDENKQFYSQNADLKPKVASEVVGMISKEFDATTIVDDVEEESAENNDDVERVTSTGIITRLDPSMPKGVIDRTYFFDFARFCSKNNEFKLQSRVDFEAIRSRTNPAWVVTAMKLHVSLKEVAKKETRRHKTLVVRVEDLVDEGIMVKWGDNKMLKLPTTNRSILPPYPVRPGDWLKVHFEQIYADEQLQDSIICYDETKCKIVSVEPNGKKTMVGKITSKGGELCVDNEIYVTLNVIKNGKKLPLDTLVRCVAVESTQKVGDGQQFQWRAIEVTLSNFMQYTSDAHNRDEEGFFEEVDISLRYRELYDNRGGIEIKPNVFVKFQPAKLGTSVAKSVSILNRSHRSIEFHKVDFPHDNTICKFELDLPSREANGMIRILSPSENFTLQIICTPLQMGRTKEVGVFDFGEFKIARDFVITGLTPEEELLSKINKPIEDGSCRPSYHRIRGEEMVETVIKDNNRTRIRGTAPVRAPFFLPTRIPRYSVPDKIWEAYKLKEEGVVRKHFPGALLGLEFKNYGEKFHVSLWFEEVDNDIRRRQYDMQGVRFKKAAQYFSFNAPYVHDIQPPVLIGDPIDVFDPQEPSVKYQGFIKEVRGTDLHVDFSETFNSAYRGNPLSVRFCLGRMTYKRQHFAVDQALKYLGESFLFPFGFLDLKQVQEPRVPFVEDEEEDTQDNPTETEMPGPSSKRVTYNSENDIGIFGKKKQPTSEIKKVVAPVVTNTNNKATSKRAQSLRTPFISECPTPKFLTEVKLRWFNKGLNEEQKNAVRRILRGQARPIPYIIYGPPGTGKTVTVVEAIMQVNKLDRNSRILVTAPTNHAADVISEHLVNSGQYHPGEFIRFNGFMRHEQVIMEAIRDYCVDGEFLDSVARNRLIISTCATAGQFFCLNLMPGHFTHVFIDEAGYCTEPENMITAVNLNIDKGGQLILAGDPNQLGPVLMSDIAQNLNLNLSFLERLMKGKTGMKNIYARNTEKYGDVNSGYNPLVLTKLVRNYRAHSSLLKLPSRLFYDGDLVACASYEEAYALTQDPIIREKVLLNQGVPIVFHGVQGTSVRERDSPSWYNAAEIMLVVDYVRKLKACGVNYEDIGIITPYRKQAEKLRLSMQLGLLEDETPKVGSIEEFQGGERQVVIISTVRSLYEEKIDHCVNKLGFIYNEKRFNVAITRAKSLMIIVGNPHVLWKDKRWNELLRYCLELRAVTGCNLPSELDQVKNKLYADLKNQEQQIVLPTLHPDMPTSTYNPDGLDDEEFEDAPELP